MCKTEQDYECPICSSSLGSDTRMAPCGHVFHEKCIRFWLDFSYTCSICKVFVRKEDLKKVYLSELNQSEKSRYIEEVLDESETLADRLEALKKRFTAYETDTAPIIADLEEILDDLNEKMNFFQELQGRNERLELELDKCLASLIKSFLRKKTKYAKSSNDIADSDAALRNMEAEIEAEIKITRKIYDKKVQEWKNVLSDQLCESKSKCELIIKIGNAPRRYINESYEKFARRLCHLNDSED